MSKKDFQNWQDVVVEQLKPLRPASGKMIICSTPRMYGKSYIQNMWQWGDVQNWDQIKDRITSLNYCHEYGLVVQLDGKTRNYRPSDFTEECVHKLIKEAKVRKTDLYKVLVKDKS